MKRRDFLATGAAGAALLGAPAILRAQTKPNVLRFVPEADVGDLRPGDLAFVADARLRLSRLRHALRHGRRNRPQPQMLEGASASGDGLTWTLVLRDRAQVHDNEPVRAQDVVPSIRRWGARDAFGQALLRLKPINTSAPRTTRRWRSD